MLMQVRPSSNTPRVHSDLVLYSRHEQKVPAQPDKAPEGGQRNHQRHELRFLKLATNKTWTKTGAILCIQTTAWMSKHHESKVAPQLRGYVRENLTQRN